MRSLGAVECADLPPHRSSPRPLIEKRHGSGLVISNAGLVLSLINLGIDNRTMIAVAKQLAYS